MCVKQLKWTRHVERMYETESQNEIWKEISEKEGPLRNQGIDKKAKCGRMTSDSSIRKSGTQKQDIGILGKWPTWRTILYHVFIFIFNSLHTSSTSCSSSGETYWVNTTSGNCHSLSVPVSCAGRKCTHFRPVQDMVTDTEWQSPEVILTQFVSPDDENDVLETCRQLSIKINTW